MKPEDKQLLFQDLCARLLYEVMVHHPDYDEPETLDTIFTPDAWDEGGIRCTIDDNWDSPHKIKYCKPYLRPMSSMTEEEIIEFNNIPSTKNYTIIENDLPWDVAHYKQIDWLNKKMFDYRGLIPKGLAIEVTKDNNPYKD